MIIPLMGVYWDCPSPSFLSLSPAHYDLRGRAVDISFLGDRWMLAHVGPDGSVSSKCYPSRDDAVAVVAKAFDGSC